MSGLPRTIILSRPDALGDAVVTLPMAGLIKQRSPGMRVIILCRTYAKAVWDQCVHADAVITLEELEKGDAPALLKALGAEAIVHVFPHRAVAAWAKQAGIALRVGTSHRLWHWWTCNKRVHFSRKRSLLHEAQLNIKLLEPFGMAMPARAELVPLLGLRPPEPDERVSRLLAGDRRVVVLHPLLGSGVGWGLANYAELMRALDPRDWRIIVTGTAAEAEVYRKALPLDLAHVADAGGLLGLHELIALLGGCHAMVAASTGPLHIAAALGARTIGLFSMRRPIFPARWAPLGTDAHALVWDQACPTCAEGRACDCITRIPVARVLELLNRR
ncbi:MAG: glycosyltransferase family 9 protein [Flavobacteriales bacterium]|nr:glycosyltransferase family 9 protein [Flavobacteriales bacterium]